MKFTKLCLILTDRCTAACEFCCFSCSPQNKQVMSESLALHVIQEAKKIGIQEISLSGGECFLYPELVIKCSEEAHQLGMAVAVATNGFWGTWDNQKIIDTLKRIAPNSVNFSRDFFHQKYVTQESFDRAYSACIELGIKAFVFVADFNGEYSAGRYLHSLGNKKYRGDIFLYPAYRTGRALQLPEKMFLTFADAEHSGCIYNGRLSIMYNGDVYPCCRHEVFGTAMKIGTISDGASLEALIEKSDVPKICNVLMKKERLVRLTEEAQAMGFSIPEKAGCSCDYCAAMFGSQEKKDNMMPAVEKIYDELLLQAVLGRGEK